MTDSAATSGLNAPQKAGQAAVIDIGSNSVRMVIYRQDGRAFWPIFNEKTLAGLGRGLSETGRLSEEGVEVSMAVLRRFRAILDARQVGSVTAFATAAVRDAEDGKAFRKQVQEQCGFSIKVLSGAEEARMTALGVVAGGAAGRFIVGDLGGSSLELIEVDEDEPAPGISLKLGPLAMMKNGELDLQAAEKIIESHLDAAASDLSFEADTLYAVGGGWRNLARIDMMLEDYPLNVLHHYNISRENVIKMTDFAIGQSPESLAEIPGASSRRAPTLPYAALLLRRLTERFDLKHVIISAYGVREGALYNRTPKADRKQDPLIASALAFARRMNGITQFGEELDLWLKPSLAKLDSEFQGRAALLYKAACIMADLGAAMHPDHRPHLVSDQALYAPFAGLDHAERCFIALALYHRYAGKTGPGPDGPLQRLLTPEQRDEAMVLGLGMRLGAVLSARTPSLLSRTQLSREGDTLILSLEKDAASLAAEASEKRLGQFALALNLNAQLTIQS